MNFKEALIAHLQGENVECREGAGYSWQDFGGYYSKTRLETFTSNGYMESFQFRLAPRTIFVNGVEVPAPEKVAPEEGASYYLADTGAVDLYVFYSWTHHDVNKTHLQRGLVYLNKEHAIARAQAMLLTSDK